MSAAVARKKPRTVTPSTPAEKDEACFVVAGQVAEEAARDVTALISAFTHVMSACDPDPKAGRSDVREALAEFYCRVLEEIDNELEGDEAKWRALLDRSLTRKTKPAEWAEWMETTGGARLTTGALDAYLAGDFDEEEQSK